MSDATMGPTETPIAGTANASTPSGTSIGPTAIHDPWSSRGLTDDEAENGPEDEAGNGVTVVRGMWHLALVVGRGGTGEHRRDRDGSNGVFEYVHNPLR